MLQAESPTRVWSMMHRMRFVLLKFFIFWGSGPVISVLRNDERNGCDSNRNYFDRSLWAYITHHHNHKNVRGTWNAVVMQSLCESTMQISPVPVPCWGLALSRKRSVPCSYHFQQKLRLDKVFNLLVYVVRTWYAQMNAESFGSQYGS